MQARLHDPCHVMGSKASRFVTDTDLDGGADHVDSVTSAISALSPASVPRFRCSARSDPTARQLGRDERQDDIRIEGNADPSHPIGLWIGGEWLE